MRVPIDLDDELRCRAVEIRDVRPDPMLAAKTQTEQLVSVKPRPELQLRARQVACASRALCPPTSCGTSRDGRFVAEGDEDGIVAGSIDADQLQPVSILADPASSAFTEQVYGFIDDQTLLLVNPSPQRFTAHRLDGGPDRDLGPTRLTPKMLEQGPLSLAPDRSAWLFSRISSYGVLDIGTGAESMLLGATDGMNAGWTPNSQAIGYVDMLQHPAQGVWVVNRDGSGTRRVIAGPYVWSYGEGTVFAWQPVWPDR